MPGGLPEGLVTTTGSVGEAIGSVGRVDLQDVARLWRDYSTSRHLLHDRVGERLANFFWRIWSNSNINSTITGETVARLYMMMEEGRDLIRTTPVPSPRSTSPVFRGETTPTLFSPQTYVKPHPSSTESEISAGSSTRPAQNQSTTLSPPPPILKRARTTDPDAPLSSVQFPSADSSEPTFPRKESSSPTSGPLSPTSSQAMERTSSNGTKKRTNYVAGGGARAKTRPSLPRRKSSQGPPPAVAESKKSPRLPPRISPPRSPTIRESQARPPQLTVARHPPPGLPALPTNTTSFELPSTSSWQDVSSPATSRMAHRTSETPQQPSSWLVDTNFRGKFVENQKGTASHTNLSSLGRSKSTVRFLDDLPERPKKANELSGPIPPPVMRRGELLSTGSTSISADGEAISNQDDDDYDANDSDDSVPIPRTKSQLSVMIAQERRKSGSYELGNSPVQPAQRTLKVREGPSQKDQDEEKDEGELVMMGRRDGVTKAGGVSRSVKGKKRMDPGDSEDLAYQSPPTPPLY